MKNRIDRWYVRCPWCLTVAVVDKDPQFLGVKCSSCDSSAEIMGRVTEKADVMLLGEKCPCDDRCTSARGPICNCKCGGENHGVGFSADIDVTTGAPVIKTASDEDVSKARDFRERLETLRKIYSEDPAYCAKCSGLYVSSFEFSRYLECRRGLESILRVKNLRSWSGRFKALSALESEINRSKTA